MLHAKDLLSERRRGESKLVGVGRGKRTGVTSPSCLGKVLLNRGLLENNKTNLGVVKGIILEFAEMGGEG